MRSRRPWRRRRPREGRSRRVLARLRSVMPVGGASSSAWQRICCVRRPCPDGPSVSLAALARHLPSGAGEELHTAPTNVDRRSMTRQATPPLGPRSKGRWHLAQRDDGGAPQASDGVRSPPPSRIEASTGARTGRPPGARRGTSLTCPILSDSIAGRRPPPWVPLQHITRTRPSLSGPIAAAPIPRTAPPTMPRRREDDDPYVLAGVR